MRRFKANTEPGKAPHTRNKNVDTALLLDRADTESQDSGFGCVRTTEMDIKEHGVKGCSMAPDLHLPGQNNTAGPPRRLSTRDPRTRQVSLASPTSLYGRAETPMADPQNIAQGCSDDLFRDLATEEVSLPSDEEDRLVIDVEDE